ncbi:D-alanine--D-alanine ligase A [Anoxybacter fermentans]|uniref:D-alanine--D-alanine ligase n=1 Tax=Anoxybacter fermentans TaxID=1323375 RepID=A0A3Q9HPX7_9FIRM|nr:D-alanine--D-alanine ligase [Anoxybacter fermentans]AZR73051.1 D-alanine--D-alanine ligase A [Anoxybacter fermentans]
MSDRLKLALIFGGRSSEHEVSIMSARSIYQAINKDKYEVFPIAITKEGRWLSPKISKKVLDDGKITSEQEQVVLITESNASYLVNIKGDWDLKLKIDLVFPVLHGPFGEDGTIQGLLEMANLPYVGAGVAASAVGMDKGMMKDIFKAKGLPQGNYKVIYRYMLEENMDYVIEELEDIFGYPCFVKPANLGSSVGVSKVHNREEMPKALQKAAEHDRKIIVEEYINCRELEVSVLGNDQIEVSIAGEIIPAKEFYDYEAKYISDNSRLLIPAPINEEKMEEIRALAIQAYRAIDCQGFARVDFFMERETEKILVNEINTIPGFTRISMYPKLWEATGLSYPELIDRLIQLALERHTNMKRNKF